MTNTRHGARKRRGTFWKIIPSQKGTKGPYGAHGVTNPPLTGPRGLSCDNDKLAGASLSATCGFTGEPRVDFPPAAPRT